MSYSILGRPRHVTDAHVEEILAWHRSRETMKQLAARLGISTTAVAKVIRTGGAHYKQPSPEKREAARVLIRAKRAALERRYLIA